MSATSLISPRRLISPVRLGSSTWLLRLRSFAVAGQLLTILAAWAFTRFEFSYLKLIALVGLTAFTNLAYAYWLRTAWNQHGSQAKLTTPLATSTEPSPRDLNDDHQNSYDITMAGATTVGLTKIDTDSDSAMGHTITLSLMLLDLVTLTAMLFLSGGVGNPFSFFYFVNLAVGGMMVRPGAAWSLTLTAILGYTSLLMFAPAIEGISLHAATSSDTLHLLGLLLAFSTCSSVVTYFVTHTSGELHERERQLRETQATESANRQLEGLTTLAAGAAHELATPLSTIDVIVRELSRHLEDVEKPPSVDEDLQLIDGQLEMCRQILQRMRSAAGDSMTLQWNRTTVGDLIDGTLEGIRDPHRVDVIDASDEVENHPLWVPHEAVAQAIRNLVHNGLDASGDEGRVILEPRIVDDHLELLVIDSGEGMIKEVMDRVGEPFFTTKEPGRGIGLGLFLTRNVVSRLGGELQFSSSPEKGTTAIVTLPLARINQ